MRPLGMKVFAEGEGAMAIRFGIVGAGWFRFPREGPSDIRGTKVAACFDTFPAAADRLADQFGCRAYHEFDGLLRNPEVRIVTLRSQRRPHGACGCGRSCRQTCHRGKTTRGYAKHCDRMIAECQKAGVLLATIFPSRFHESSHCLKMRLIPVTWDN